MPGLAALQDIGGLDIQKQEIREAVELPLTHHELYKQIGIDPPRGVLLYGVPGTGKTMLAKAVAHHTTAAFIRVVGSEFVQKYLGEARDRLEPWQASNCCCRWPSLVCLEQQQCCRFCDHGNCCGPCSLSAFTVPATLTPCRRGRLVYRCARHLQAME